jgi:methyl-accepting chemotaxis protein
LGFGRRAVVGSGVAIAEISTVVGKIDNYQLTIASAVEEQSATTGEMNRAADPGGPLPLLSPAGLPRA